jgi:hypothetical protein
MYIHTYTVDRPNLMLIFERYHADPSQTIDTGLFFPQFPTLNIVNNGEDACYLPVVQYSIVGYVIWMTSHRGYTRESVHFCTAINLCLVSTQIHEAPGVVLHSVYPRFPRGGGFCWVQSQLTKPCGF